MTHQFLDINQASEILPLGKGLSLVRFDSYNKKFSDKSDPYYPLLEWLYDTGMHRNIFLYDEKKGWRWRIADWEIPNALEDSFVAFERDGDNVNGITFDGQIFRIDVETGGLTWIEWRKFG